MGRAALMLALGTLVARLVRSGGYSSFVQQRMQIPLIFAAVMLLVFGVIEAIGAYRQDSAEPSKSRESISPTVGWLLATPLLVLVAVAPTSLGAAAAQRAEPLTPTERNEPQIEPVDDSNGPAEMRVYEFLSRALWDDTGTLTGKQIVLEGIVVNDDEISDGFRLTRFAVSCCAADGLPLQVALRDLDQSFEDDTWVRATVVWRPPPEGGYQAEGAPEVVEADVIGIELIEDPPDDPYETPF
ncbi:MAG: TIGR03943 family protein [Ilumatobacter sp.]